MLRWEIFHLRGGKESRNLKISQLTIMFIPKIGLRIIVKHSVNCVLKIRWFQSLHSLSVETGAMSIS